MILEEREILDGHPILKNHPIYRYSDPIRVYRKQPSSTPDLQTMCKWEISYESLI